jgi:hypothetical protein
MYNDQAEHRLPRLKKAYMKKCQEVEVGCTSPIGVYHVADPYYFTLPEIRIKKDKMPQ